MKKVSDRKLLLGKETLSSLTTVKLAVAQGGAWSEDSVCPTTAPSEVGRCY
jgi:hypothetical protein